ncbi:hypothetical protein O6H91_16G061700 [Diphasiastrum complanatum]|uniref:Uncharacterized protein n=1 Tax=Diphasiastrum complanatum TaxID=34168 RepID=A0ACC2BCU7_DIPCM|nr:hypothetical protein O6H91_16G061700 [Diphasiastrum complanatum]
MSRRSRRREALALEAMNDELLAQISERICCNGSSSVASLFTKQGKKGTNQDAMILWEFFVEYLMVMVRTGIWLRGGATGLELSDAKGCKEPEMFALWQDSFLKAYKLMDTELRVLPSIDCSCSGTTAVTILKQGEHLIIGNVGDSRAILATKTENDALVAVQLTVDLKPNLPHEAERIKQCKGRVFAMLDEPDVHRLWLPYNNSPGLAVARAFGDFYMKEFGLIAVPEIAYRRLTDKDQFIVLATDGIWDVLSNTEVVDIISKAPSRATAARCLVQSAVRAWRLKRSLYKADDCAVVCLYLGTQSVRSQKSD